MKIDGDIIAGEISTALKSRIRKLKSRGVIPKLGIILASQDPSSLLYVSRKKKFGEKLGIEVDVINYRPYKTASKRSVISSFLKIVNRADSDLSFHGIIIQRPVPLGIDEATLKIMVSPEKDIDGFRKDSLYDPPIALSVREILRRIFTNKDPKCTGKRLSELLKGERILVIGRGVTGGKPISDMLKNLKVAHKTAGRDTQNIRDLVKKSTIIISCVGNNNIVRHTDLSCKPIVIGVGMHKYRGRFEPDFNQKEIALKASYYTPVPGGVGPVNVAYLFANLVNAAENQLNQES